MEVTKEDKTFSAIAHLAPLFGYLIGFGQLLIPLAILLIKTDSPFIREQAKESLNFQISMTLYCVGAGVLCLVLIGFLILPVLMIFGLVTMIQATLKANEGEFYRYPLCLRLVK